VKIRTLPLSVETIKAITTHLRDAMLAVSPPMVVAANKPRTMEIIGNTAVPYGAKKKIIPVKFFASFVVRWEMVSFYLFSIYMHPEAHRGLAPHAIKCLKGRSCLNFRKPEQVIRSEIDALLKAGVRLWKAKGFLK
jgi:hypothetical protein